MCAHILKPPQDFLNKWNILNKCTNIRPLPLINWFNQVLTEHLLLKDLLWVEEGWNPPGRVETIEIEVALVPHLSNMCVTKAKGPLYPRGPVIAALTLCQFWVYLHPSPLLVSHYPCAFHGSSSLFLFPNVYFGTIFSWLFVLYLLRP